MMWVNERRSKLSCVFINLINCKAELFDLEIYFRYLYKMDVTKTESYKFIPKLASK